MILATTVLLSVVATVAKAQNINVQSLSQCATSVINFGASTAPYYVAVLPAVDPCAHDALQEFHDVYDTSVNYYVNLPEGTQVLIYVEDANETEVWSETYTIGGGDPSCLPGYVAPAPAPENNYVEPAPESNNNYEYEQETEPEAAPVEEEQQEAAPEEEVEPSSSSSSEPPAYTPPIVATSSSSIFVPRPAVAHTLTASEEEEKTTTTGESEITDTNLTDGAANAISGARSTTALTSTPVLFGAMLVAFFALF